MSKISTFFKEVISEFKKVSWPSNNEVNASVKMIIGSTLVLSIVLSLFDAGVVALMHFIF